MCEAFIVDFRKFVAHKFDLCIPEMDENQVKRTW